MLTDQRVARHIAVLRDAGCEVVTVCRTDIPVRYRRGWRFYAAFNWRLWRWIRREVRSGRCDVVWANDTDTLLGCWMAVRKRRTERGERRVKLVMDAHELFPEVPEIVDKPVVKWVWRMIEKWLMPQCDALITVCQSIADYYKEKYGVEMTVVRNLQGSGCQSASARQQDEAVGSKEGHVMLYAGKVNVGRGVDWAIDALEWLPECRLVVAGDGDLLEEMKEYAAQKAWADRVEFTGRLMPEEMAALTAKADVGLVMLEDRGLSYHYALPNRVGAFVQAGVPMVVSDLPEMARVVRTYGVGAVIEGKNGSERTNAEALVEAVKRVLAREWKEEDFVAARQDMDWNKEKVKLLECLKAITQ
ncbi:MAG: glycosyltransferase [Bacteroidales bacterium]|nr:glycosyltransferase [Bacteroidales bacterium]